MNKNIVEKGFCSSKDMEKINAYSRRELSEDEVYVFNVRLCDNEIDRDYECFSLSALNELAQLFVGKTGIFDHSMKASEQKSRIFETCVEKQAGEKTSYGDELYILKAKAYMLRNDENKALIEEIDAGIKKEVSVSCSMGKSICSICGKDNRVQRCEHIGGQTYKNKLCFKSLEEAKDAYEFSFVAVPAQKNAGVTKAYKIEEDLSMDDIIKTIKSCSGSVELSEKQALSLTSYIEDLEEKSKLSEEYRAELSKEVIKLFALKFPEMEKSLINSVVSVMTLKELKGFKSELKKSKSSPQPQLMKKTENNQKDNSFFKI